MFINKIHRNGPQIPSALTPLIFNYFSIFKLTLSVTFFFGGVWGSNPRRCIYYALSLPIVV